ncbi:MAG: ATP-binding protein [Thermoanaerobaculia bacterium]
MVCEKCGGLKWIIDKKTGKAIPCKCQEKVKREDFSLPSRFANATFENFQTYKQSSLFQAKKIAEEFAKKFPAIDYGIILIGPNGVGKTHLACAILNRIYKEKGIKGLFLDYSNLNFQLKDTFSGSEEESTNSLIEMFIDAPLLLLDDLGSIKPSAWFLDTVYEIINQRYLRNKLMLITSAYQLSGEGGRENLSGRIGDALVSRILEICKVVEIQAKDHRKEVFQAGYKNK